MRKGIYTLLFFCVFIILSNEAKAEVVLDDSFDSTNMINLDATTAEVDKNKGEIRLPRAPTPNAIAMNDYFGEGYAVATETGIQFFALDEDSGQLLKEMELSVSSPLNVALSQRQKTVFVHSNGSVKRFDYTGNGFIQNPAMEFLGVDQVVSIASIDEMDGVVTLSKTGDVEVYSSDWTQPLSFDTGISAPVAVSVVPNTADLVITSKDKVFYLPFTGSSYTSPIQVVTGVSGFVSATADTNGNVTAVRFESGSGIMDQFLRFGNSVELSKRTVVSPTVGEPVAISMSENFTFAYVTKDGRVEYFASNGNEMVPVPVMKQASLSLTEWHQSPKTYQSVVVSTNPFDLVRVIPASHVTTNQSITYEISTDGGSTFWPVTPNTWTNVPLGSQLILRATLFTSNPKTTPVLDRVIVETSVFDIYDLTVTRQYFPGGNQVDSTPTQNFPVYEMAGGQVEFTVKTSGGVQEVKALFSDGTSLDLVPLNALDEADNVFYGWCAVPLELEDGDSINVELIAKRGVKEKMLTQTPFIVVDGNVKSLLDIRLVE